MPARTGGTQVLTLLPESVPRIFEQAQTSTANHQKNFVALNKLHNEAALIIQPAENGKKMQLVGEKAFEDLFIDMLLRVLPLKKGATVVDRIVKFVAGYVKFINEKGTQNSRYSTIFISSSLSLQRNKGQKQRMMTTLLPPDSSHNSSSTFLKDLKRRTRMFASAFSKL